MTDHSFNTTTQLPSKSYFELFPSLYLTYSLPKDNELQLNYTRRVNRPRGRQINPFKDYSDSTNISYGNPDLMPEFSSSFEFSYMRKRLLNLIKNETENAAKGKPAYIYCKINHVVDDKIIDKLHLASKAGVDIRMLVRGNCALIPGIPGLSQHIEVTGIIDRFLEHASTGIQPESGSGIFC